ncbi:hypothetical protein D3C71_1274380 [compost metagenome]
MASSSRSARASSVSAMRQSTICAFRMSKNISSSRCATMARPTATRCSSLIWLTWPSCTLVRLASNTARIRSRTSVPMCSVLATSSVLPCRSSSATASAWLRMVRSTEDSWFRPSIRIKGRRLMPLMNSVSST